MSIYRKQSLEGVPWNQLKSEDTGTLYFLSELKKPVPRTTKFARTSNSEIRRKIRGLTDSF